MRADDRLLIELLHLDGVAVLELRGEIDSFTAPRLQGILETVCSMGVPVVLDMDRVSFMDSSGLSALITVFGVSERTPDSVQITRPSDQVRRILSLTGLDSVFLAES